MFLLTGGRILTDSFVFSPGPRPVAALRGSAEVFPVNRIFCVGRNYLAHAAEMGATVDKHSQEPIYFQKNPVHLVASGATVPYPPGTSELHHEMELVVALGSPGFEVVEHDANALIFGYACGLDMTRRDLQRKAKKGGDPWDLAKDFEQSAVLSPIAPTTVTGILDAGRIELSVNGELRQASDLSKMIWSVPEIVSHLSRFYHLEPGDLIYTGTPEGVGALGPGDEITGRIDGVGDIALTIGPS